MDQNNQNNFSNLSSNNFSERFTGISSNSTNSLMSTLHSLRIQNIGNSILSSNDLSCDFPNQLLFEQIQLRAMQSVYSSLGQNLESKISAELHQNSNLPPSNDSVSQKTIQQYEPLLASSLFIPPPSDNIRQIVSDKISILNYVNSEENIKNPIQLSPLIFPVLPTSAVTLVPKNAADVLNSLKESHSMPGPTVESLEDLSKLEKCPLSNEDVLSVEEFSTSNSLEKQTIEKNVKSVLRLTNKQNKKDEAINNQNMESEKSDYDEAHDDVEHIFGLSLSENDSRNDSLFRNVLPGNKGLSPINFTPPDSPNEELTLDMLFGLPEKAISIQTKKSNNFVCSSKNTKVKCTEEFDLDILETQENDTSTSISKLDKIPVYKQTAVLMSIEAKTAARKEDPNYDAFEFEDEEDIMNMVATENNKKNDISSKKETTWKNIYVSGKGFISSNEEKEQEMTSTKKIQPKVFPQNNELTLEKTWFTHADSLRENNDKRLECTFFKSSQKNETECSRNIRQVRPNEPKLPKFCIHVKRIQKNVSEKNKLKRTKTRISSEEEDSDWDGNKQKKRIRKIYSLSEVLNDQNRLKNSYSGTEYLFNSKLCIRSQFDETVRRRLHLFGPAEGILPKGTYVVCKTDVLKEDCALWRVDNQNLLQKFPPFREVHTNKQIYKSSSTYSGWCEQISAHYFRVAVKILKQNRSETIIEPEVPLHNLFSAMSTELFKNPRSVYVKENRAESLDEHCFQDMRQVSLNNLIDVFLTQSVSTNFLDNLIDKKDWAYTRSLNEIEKANNEAERHIRKRIYVEKKYINWIEDYTRLSVSRNSFHCLTKCQICKMKKSRKVIHFFHKKEYNANTLLFNFENNSFNKSDVNFQPVVDVISCGRCAIAIDYLHKMRHLKLHLLLKCEEKLEKIGTEEIDQTPEKNIEMAKSDKRWVLSLIEKYCSMWEKIHFNFRVL